ncbi:MAG: hypothetical protein HKN28_05550 [Alphaproteobacteria bacterium]|nr:hypothetical protein [Alphaproteobacteria bacterium]
MPNALKFPFAPLLLAGLAPVWLFQSLSDVLRPEDLVRPAIVLVAAFALFLVAVKFLTGSWHRASLWSLGPLILLGMTTQGIAFLAGLAVPIVFGLIIDKGRVGVNSTFVLNLFAILQLGMAVFVVGPTLFVPNGITLSGSIPGETKLNQQPSIIHIVLDGYAASDVITDLYGHDNSTFETALKNQGFTVMERAFTPHNQTLFAMASVMNGTFVKTEDLPDIDTQKLRLQLGKAATKGAAPEILRATGYNFAYASNAFRPLHFGNGALRISGPPARFNSMESRLIARVRPLSEAATADHNAQVRNAFAPENYTIPAPPFFYFQHILSPHPPFSLTADGEFRSTILPVLSDASHFVKNSDENRRRYVEGYGEKLKYTNRALLQQLQDLPSGPIVVIIHGDHGSGSLWNHESLERSCALERFGTFFAVYSNVPQVQQAFADLSGAPFNLVNTYRVLFSALSDSEFENLPDTSFFNRWYEPRHLEPVSPDVRAASCTAHPSYRVPNSASQAQ